MEPFDQEYQDALYNQLAPQIEAMIAQKFPASRGARFHASGAQASRLLAELRTKIMIDSANQKAAIQERQRQEQQQVTERMRQEQVAANIKRDELAQSRADQFQKESRAAAAAQGKARADETAMHNYVRANINFNYSGKEAADKIAQYEKTMGIWNDPNAPSFGDTVSKGAKAVGSGIKSLVNRIRGQSSQPKTQPQTEPVDVVQADENAATYPYLGDEEKKKRALQVGGSDSGFQSFQQLLNPSGPAPIRGFAPAPNDATGFKSPDFGADTEKVPGSSLNKGIYEFWKGMPSGADKTAFEKQYGDRINTYMDYKRAGGGRPNIGVDTHQGEGINSNNLPDTLPGYVEPNTSVKKNWWDVDGSKGSEPTTPSTFDPNAGKPNTGNTGFLYDLTNGKLGTQKGKEERFEEKPSDQSLVTAAPSFLSRDKVFEPTAAPSGFDRPGGPLGPGVPSYAGFSYKGGKEGYVTDPGFTGNTPVPDVIKPPSSGNAYWDDPYFQGRQPGTSGLDKTEPAGYRDTWRTDALNRAAKTGISTPAGTIANDAMATTPVNPLTARKKPSFKSYSSVYA